MEKIIFHFSIVSLMVPKSIWLFRFCDDVEQMIGSRPSMFWRVCWKFISPIFLFIILIFSLIDFIALDGMEQFKNSLYAKPCPRFEFLINENHFRNLTFYLLREILSSIQYIFIQFNIVMPTEIHAKTKNRIQYENEAVSVILLTSHFFESKQAESKWPFESYSFQTTSNPEK